MHDFSQILLSPPEVALLRLDLISGHSVFARHLLSDFLVGCLGEVWRREPGQAAAARH